MNTLIKEFKVFLRNHVPFNKYSHEVKNGTCEVRVKSYDGSSPVNSEAWVEITLTETYTPESGKRVQSKTIHATLNSEQRLALIAELTK